MPATSAVWNGSPSRVSAISTEINGAVPIRIEARDGPASRTDDDEQDLRRAGDEHADERRRPRAARAGRSTRWRAPAAAATASAVTAATAAPASGLCALAQRDPNGHRERAEAYARRARRRGRRARTRLFRWPVRRRSRSGSSTIARATAAFEPEPARRPRRLRARAPDGLERRQHRRGRPAAGDTPTGSASQRSGLFTTALFVTHLALQIPAGKASDRFGPRRVGLLGLVVIAVFSSDLADRARHRADARRRAPLPASAPVSRSSRAAPTSGRREARRSRRACSAASVSPAAVSRSRSCRRSRTGSAGAHPLRRRSPWRSPVSSSSPSSPGDGARRRTPARGRRGRGILRDTRLYSLAVLYAASLGLSVVIGNWIVTLLHRRAGSTRAPPARSAR